jgi:hypothetical protein
MINQLLIWLRTRLGHLRDQKSTERDAAHRETETEYDDRESISPFVPEEQRMESEHHKTSANDQTEQSAHQRELVRWTRNLAWVTGALAAATFIVAAFSGWQVYQGRIAADQQHADTLTALSKTDVTIAALNSQVGIMRGQLDEMRAGQRPWVSLNTALKSGLVWNKDGLPMFNISYKIRNVGKTPALSVHWWFGLEPLGSAFDGGANMQKRQCGQRDMSLNTPTSKPFLLPNDELTDEQYIGMTADDVASATIHNGSASAISIYLVGCVSYFISGEKEIHGTGFDYMVGILTSDGPGTPFMPMKEAIPFQQIMLIPYWHGNYAN